MAPNLAESQHAQIRDMILRERPPAEIADVASCSAVHLRSVLDNDENTYHVTFGLQLSSADVRQCQPILMRQSLFRVRRTQSRGSLDTVL
jgi:hypothetical protein